MSTRHVRVLLVTLFAALLIASVPGSAHAQATSLFLKITGINALAGCGLSTDSFHKGEIILRSVEENIFHPTDPITGLPLGTSVDGRTLKVVKDPDPCSPTLFLTMLQDRLVQEINIFFVRTVAEIPREVATIRASDVQIVGINLASNAGGAATEIVSFALLGQLQLTVLKFDETTGQPAGSITTCWSFAANKRC
jgi:type VI protein secretion system component Hcp